MALHEKDKIKDRINDDVYAASDLSVVMPKYKMPEKNTTRAMHTRWYTMN